MPHAYKGIPLVLLTAVGRSGTNAVRRALGRHPAIDSTGCENNVINDVLDTARRNCTVRSRRVTMRVGQSVYRRQFRDLILNLLWPHPRPDRPGALLAFSDLHPDNADFLGQLFPGARTVVLVRNGVEVVASRMLYQGFRHRSFEHHCMRWSAGVEIARWARLRPGAHVVRHEALLERDAAELAFGELLHACGLPIAPACVDSLFEEPHIHPTVAPHEGKHLRNDLAGRARRALSWSADQRRTFTRICGPAMRELGYDLPWAANPSAVDAA